jgi:GTP-binding protein
MFMTKSDKPALRIGEFGLTLPLPVERLVSDQRMQKVKFVGATQDPDACPPADGLAEVAVIGRSNVGKSSVLNMLTLGSTGAIVSAKPGTTQEINHYLVDNKWRLVDLPGYGYAKAPEEERQKWDRFTKTYFTTRENLAGVLLLVDASIPPMAKDREYADWLIKYNVPFTIVWTKCDRKKPGLPTVAENQANLTKQLDDRWHRLPSMIPTSAVSKEGRGDLLRFISSIIVLRRIRSEETKRMRRKETVHLMRSLKDHTYKNKSAVLTGEARPLTIMDFREAAKAG